MKDESEDLKLLLWGDFIMTQIIPEKKFWANVFLILCKKIELLRKQNSIKNTYGSR